MTLQEHYRDWNNNHNPKLFVVRSCKGVCHILAYAPLDVIPGGSISKLYPICGDLVSCDTPPLPEPETLLMCEGCRATFLRWKRLADRGRKDFGVR